MSYRDLAVVVACSLACMVDLGCSGSDALGGAGGHSGSGGASGTGGAAGRGGSGGGGAAGRGGAANGDAGAALTVPSCLQELYAACPESGACTVERTDAGVDQSYCYPSGVRAEYTMNGGGCSPTELRVYKADGSLCYIEQSERTNPPNVICEGSSYTWRNAAGAVVATGVSSIGDLRIACAGTDERLQCDPTFCPSGIWPMRYGCQPGACP